MMHDFLNRSSKIPPAERFILSTKDQSFLGRYVPMYIKNINIVGLQFLQTVPYGNIHALCRIPCVVALHRQSIPVVKLVSRRILCCDDHLISHVALGHPYSDYFLTILGIVRIGSVDEVAAKVEKGIEQLEGFFIFAEDRTPGTANADTTKC